MKNFFTSLAALFVGIFLSTQLNAQYCVPTGLSSTWDGIQRVATSGGVTNFSNSSGIRPAYTNYSGTQKVSVKKGSSFTLQITNSWQGNAWIDFNGDGDFTDPGEDLNIYTYKTTSSAGGRSYHTVTIPFSAMTGTSRMRIGCGYDGNPPRIGPCGSLYSNYGGEYEDYAIEFIPPPANDAGVSALKVPTICAGTNDLDVFLENYGTNTLTSAVVQGSFGGTNYGPDTLTGLSVAPGEDTIITLGQYTATSGNTYLVNASAYFPNGVVDGDATNNAMSTQRLTPAMSGTFTIDPSGGGDYTSFTAAMSDLRARQVCDTVYMDVVSGTYNGFIEFRGVVGAGPYAPIIFRSAPGNTSAPVLTNGGNPVEFDDSWWITLDGFDIKTTSSYSDVIYFQDNNDHITIQNCDISKPANTSTSQSYSLIYMSTSSVDHSDNITIDNCNLTNGSYGIYAYGNSGLRLHDWTVNNCTFTNQYYRHNWFYYVDDVTVTNNTFKDVRYSSYCQLNYIYYVNGALIDGNTWDISAGNNYGYVNYVYYSSDVTFTNNSMDLNTGASYRYASYFYSAPDAVIADNDIRLYGSRTAYGIYVNSYSDRALIERNTISLESSTTSYGMYLREPRGSSGNPSIIRNNIVNQPIFTGGTSYGMQVWYPDYVEIVHNTIRLNSANASSSCLYVYEFGTPIDVYARNNILNNDGNGYALYMSGLNSINFRDNNVYSTQGNCLGYISGCKADLAAMQATGTAQDAGSIEHVVDFFDANTDLHVFYDATVDGVGSAALSVAPEDFDGQARDPLNPDPGMDEFRVPQNSVTLLTIDNPTTPLCGLVTDYDISVQNIGTANLDSFNVDGMIYHLGGGSTPLTTFQYAPSSGIAPAGFASFNAGSLSGGFQNGDTLTIWVSLPNGVNDSIPNDDTLSVFLTDGLSGVFTVGDTSTGSYDYASLRHAQTLLDSVGAICDTVFFEVATGTYEGMTIPYMVGSSAQAPVVIRSMAGDADSVTINQASGANGAINLDNSGNVIIENVSLAGTGAGHALNMMGQGENVWVSNSKLRSSGSNTSSNSAVVYLSGERDNISITDSRISGGSYGLYIVGNSTNSPASNLVVENIEFVNTYYMGAYFNNVDGLEFNGNDISSTSSYTNGYGVYQNNVNGRINVHNNNLNSSSDWPRYGMYNTGVSGTSNFPALFENNIVKIGYSTYTNSMYAFYATNSNFVNLNHNTIVTEGTNSGASATYFAGGGGNQLTNNIFANMGSGYGLYISGTFTITNSNHNDIYAAGNNLGYFNAAISSFSGWQSTSGLDQNSVSDDPGFYSSSDFRVCSDSLDGRGTPTGLMYDFEGEMRSASTPDIGADEFTAPANFRLPADTTICKGDVLNLSASLNSGTFAIWNNFQPSNNFSVSTPGVYKAFVANTCGQSIDSIEVSWADPVELVNDTHLCAGASFTANAGIAAANGTGATYMWSTGSTAQTLNIASRGIYAVEVTDNIGCVSVDTIAVTQSRGVSLPADTSFCDGKTYVVNANVGAGNYFWSPTGQTGPVIFVNQSGTYRVNYTDNKFCTSIDEIVVDVVLDPVADFTYFQKYYSVSFTDLSSDASTYMWTFGDGDTSYASNPAHIYASAGTYTVTQYIMNSCGTDVMTQKITISNLTGSEELAELNGISLFPNPNSGMFDLAINGVDDQVLNIKVVALDGKVVFNTEVQNSGVTELNIDLGNLATGVYLVRVQGDTYNAVEKVTIK